MLFIKGQSTNVLQDALEQDQRDLLKGEHAPEVTNCCGAKKQAKQQCSMFSRRELNPDLLFKTNPLDRTQ